MNVKLTYNRGGFCVQHATIRVRKDFGVRMMSVRFLVWSWRDRDAVGHQILN